jgi:hypothetical protein
MAMVKAEVVPNEVPFSGVKGTAMYCHRTPLIEENNKIKL